jgi:hemolysin III
MHLLPFFGLLEPVSALTHLVAALVVVGAAPSLLRLGGSRRRVAGLATFLAGAVALLLCSSAYHSVGPGPTRELIQRFDHAAIWGLIVGTLTPIVIVILKGWARKLSLVGMWALAFAFIALKTLFFEEISEWVGLAMYVGFAWVGALFFFRLGRDWGWGPVAWCLAGGVSYTGGAILEYTRSPVIIPGVFGPHEVFHLAIVLGIVLHWVTLAELMRRVSQRQGEGRVEGSWWDARSRRWTSAG